MAGYCPEHDPITVAGQVDCGVCGRVGYPTDAVWVGARLILATYDPACSHWSRCTWIFDLDAPNKPSRWCGAATRTGDPCRNRAPEPGRPCHLHDRTREGGR